MSEITHTILVCINLLKKKNNEMINISFYEFTGKFVGKNSRIVTIKYLFGRKLKGRAF